MTVEPMLMGTDDLEVRARRLGLIWLMLFVNTWAFIGGPLLLPIPHPAAQLVTMGCLVGAFLLSLLWNPRMQIRPNAVLFVTSLISLAALASGLRLENGIGALFRSGRGMVFIATMWLLSPMWQYGLEFVRAHLRALGLALALVVAGAMVSPARAYRDTDPNRLRGIIWPMPPPQVAEYSAIAAGLIVVLWLGGLIAGRTAGALGAATFVILILTHTRTALLGMVVGTIVAGLSLIPTNRRARRFVGGLLGGGALIGWTLGGFIMGWLSRGQDTQALSNLTGRQTVWNEVLAQPRTLADEIFGFGLANKSFNGLSIDSTWISVYQEQGMLGLLGVGTLFAVVVFAALVRPPSPGRACAIFIVTYEMISSYTEVGLGDTTSYLGHLIVAAALLSTSEPKWAVVRGPSRRAAAVV